MQEHERLLQQALVIGTLVLLPFDYSATRYLP